MILVHRLASPSFWKSIGKNSQRQAAMGTGYLHPRMIHPPKTSSEHKYTTATLETSFLLQVFFILVSLRLGN
jgi:hypothetical protein